MVTNIASLLFQYLVLLFIQHSECCGKTSLDDQRETSYTKSSQCLEVSFYNLFYILHFRYVNMRHGNYYRFFVISVLGLAVHLAL